MNQVYTKINYKLLLLYKCQRLRCIDLFIETVASKRHVQSWQWFAGGMTFALGLATAGILLTRRFLYPNPERVLRSIIPKLRASREVCDLIGHQLEPGLFRAYTHSGGMWQWAGPPFIIKWRPRKYQ